MRGKISHKQLIDGQGQCCVPMWSMGLPSGFCDEPAYSPQTKNWIAMNRCKPAQRQELCRGPYYLVCQGHGGISRPEVSDKFKGKCLMDGNAWCAIGHDFINLQESHAAFGDTPVEAMENYMKTKKCPECADNGTKGGLDIDEPCETCGEGN